MQLLLRDRKILEATYFQILQISSKFVKNFIDFFESEKVIHGELTRRGENILIFAEATEAMADKLGDYHNYAYYTFGIREFLELFEKLIGETYALKSIDLPKFFEDEKIENQLYENLLVRNYDVIISTMKGYDMLINKFSVKKDDSSFTVYKSGAFFINDRSQHIEAFFRILKEFFETARETEGGVQEW